MTEVFCDHREMKEVKTKEGKVILRYCAACTLSEFFCDEPFKAVPGEVLHWAARKMAAYKSEQEYRPHVQRIMDARVEKRAQRNMLEELLDFARVEFPDDVEGLQSLEREIAAMLRERDTAWP